MGNLLRLLSRTESSAASPDSSRDIFIDMEFAQPTEQELPQYKDTAETLARSQDILCIIESYPGAANEIREAIRQPQDEIMQRRAWDCVRPLIDSLSRVHSFCTELEQIVDSLLDSLCSSERTAKEHLEQQQALFTQFALIVDFAVKFDEIKMNRPSVNNDLSYFKRAYLRYKDSESSLSPEDTSALSMFFASTRPMMELLNSRTTKFMSQHKSATIDITSECLAAIADICRGLVANPGLRQRLQKPEETVPLCLRVMTGVCVLYDYAHPLGVFHKKSLLDYRGCIRALRQEREFRSLCESLINVLKFSTHTLNSPTTPKAVLALLED